MCNAVSGMTKSDGTIKMPKTTEWNHSHSKIAADNGIPNGLIGDTWARWECTPKNGDFSSDPHDHNNWVFKLDEERVPQWWKDDATALEDSARAAVKRYMASVLPGLAPYSVVSSTGDYAASSSTCDRAASSSTGHSAASSSTGDYAASSSTGDYAASSSTGYRAASSSTGFGAASSSTGNRAASSSTGDSAASSSTGAASAAVCVGRNCRARAGADGVLVIAERDANWKLIGWCVGVVGKDGIKANTWYRASGGKLVKCEPDDEVVSNYETVTANAAKVLSDAEARAAS